MTITRSFSRKINLGNYESADFFSSRSYVFDEGYEPEYMDEVSVELHDKCKEEVEKEIERFLGEIRCNYSKVKKVVDSLSIGNPAESEEYDSLNQAELDLVQAIKRAYARSPEAKEGLITRKKCVICDKNLTVAENMTSDKCKECRNLK
jgi:hypothetical protein